MAVITLCASVGLASCGGSGDSTGTTTGDTASNSTLAVSEGSVVVNRQWARASAMGTTMGAAYMDITATGGDELVEASVDASVAMMTELHEVVMADNQMKMQQVDKISLPAGETVALKPGGYHVMFMGLAAPLTEGSSIALTLTFATAGTITIDVPVLADAP